MPATFDGPNLLIILPAATATIDAKVDLYSDWKEFVKVGANAKFLKAFDTTGGDPTQPTQDVAAYFFLRNDLGWRIRPAEENAEVSIVGNLYARESTLPIFVPTVGAFTALVTIERSVNALEVQTGGGGGFDPVTDLVEPNTTYEEAQRIILAAAAGLLSGAGTKNVKIRDINNSKNRIDAVVDEEGNRITVTLDKS